MLLPFGRDTVHGLYGVIHISPLRGGLYKSPAHFVNDYRVATARPLFQRGTAKPGGRYPKTNAQSPYKWKRYMCWLRQRYTYPATVVAPLSKGDAAAVPIASTFSIHSKQQTDRHRASPLLEGYGEAGGYVS